MKFIFLSFTTSFSLYIPWIIFYNKYSNVAEDGGEEYE